MAVEKEGKKESPKASKAKKETNELRITLVRSVIGRPRKQREVVKGLGLRRIDSTVIRQDCPEIRGMINKVIHLVKVEAIDTK